MNDLLPEMPKTWQEYVNGIVDRAKEQESDLVADAPELSKLIRRSMPVDLALDAAYAGVYKTVSRRLKDLGLRGTPQEGRRSRRYETPDQMTFEGLLDWVIAQMKMRNGLTANMVATTEEFLDAHPDCEWSVAEIILMAEERVST